jgi:hypothetical protein
MKSKIAVRLDQMNMFARCVSAEETSAGSSSMQTTPAPRLFTSAACWPAPVDRRGRVGRAPPRVSSLEPDATQSTAIFGLLRLFSQVRSDRPRRTLQPDRVAQLPGSRRREGKNVSGEEPNHDKVAQPEPVPSQGDEIPEWAKKSETVREGNPFHTEKRIGQ